MNGGPLMSLQLVHPSGAALALYLWASLSPSLHKELLEKRCLAHHGRYLIND